MKTRRVLVQVLPPVSTQQSGSTGGGSRLRLRRRNRHRHDTRGFGCPSHLHGKGGVRDDQATGRLAFRGDWSDVVLGLRRTVAGLCRLRLL